jgi:hypothetical protein
MSISYYQVILLLRYDLEQGQENEASGLRHAHPKLRLAYLFLNG